jgi:hypothetical protein
MSFTPQPLYPLGGNRRYPWSISSLHVSSTDPYRPRCSATFATNLFQIRGGNHTRYVVMCAESQHRFIVQKADSSEKKTDHHYFLNFIRYRYIVGRDNSVGIAIRYGLDGSGIEFRCGAMFSPPVQTGPL